MAGPSTTPMVDDEVLIRGRVTKYRPGVGLVVELFSKTDQYEAWVREDRVVEVVLPELPSEPPDGTWLVGVILLGEQGSHIFRRDDDEGHNDRETRRHDRRWWDYTAQEWVSWPEAVRRGANPALRLVAAPIGGEGTP